MADDLRVKLATCCRMMECFGLFDFNGHVSARLTGTDHILINSWGKSRASLTPEDIIKVDMEGRVVERGTRAPSETPLHLAIYRMRPDVQSVAHTHSPMVIALSIAQMKIVPVVSHGRRFPLTGVPVYDDCRNIDTPERALEVGRLLGPGRAVIFRGHGAVLAEPSVEGVLYTSFCLEDNAKMLFAASQMGRPQILRSEEMEEGQTGEKGLFGKAWSYFRDKANIGF